MRNISAETALNSLSVFEIECAEAVTLVVFESPGILHPQY
jgi:hypothetical protein